MLSAGRAACERALAARGFSLIELMVTLSVAAFLLTTAAPAVSSWIADSHVRSVADTLQNAVRLAQAEAIARSRPAVLALTTDAPALGTAPAANGPRWMVRLLGRDTDTEDDAAALFLRGGAEAATMGVSVTGPALVCFNGFGQQVTLASTATGLDTACTAPADATHPTTYALTHAGGSRTLQVQVGLGGQVRMCDPAKTLAADTPEGC